MDPFVETILMSSAFRAATGQGKGTHVYRSLSSGEDKRRYDASKKQFRSAFRDAIKSKCRSYDARITTEDDWMSLIHGVRDSLTADHQAILEAQKLRFGIENAEPELEALLEVRRGDEATILAAPGWPSHPGRDARLGQGGSRAQLEEAR